MSRYLSLHSHHSPTLTARFGSVGQSVIARRMRAATTPPGSFSAASSRWFMSPSANRTHPNGSFVRTRRITSRSVASLRTDHSVFVLGTHRVSSIDAPRRASRRSVSARLANEGGSGARGARGACGTCGTSSSGTRTVSRCGDTV